MPRKISQKARTWGTRFDPLPSSPPASPQPDCTEAAISTVLPKVENKSEISSKKKDERISHDASIFVGSLPCNIDHQELTRMLSEHLCEHSEIKYIKVVRDSKGGVCAFVQCEDAASAARLIQTLHSSEPRPFLGRILRYEPARAFRTLLISYRTPFQLVPSDKQCSDHVNGGQGKLTELELPFAMRLWRSWKTKFTSVLYNSEAQEAESQAASVFQGHDMSHILHNRSLYLDPLIHDVETLHKIAAYFGSLEYFRSVPFSPFPSAMESSNGHLYSKPSKRSYPGPHNAPRTSVMDPGCWEVRWNHRDDCVCAWMTLRRVPHLTVTWAHHSSASGYDSHSFTSSLPIQPSSHGESEVSVEKDSRSAVTPSISMPAKFLDLNTTTPTLNTSVSENWSKLCHSRGDNLTGNDLDTKSLNTDAKNGKGLSFGTSDMEWTEMDFPPLGDYRRERQAEASAWIEKRTSKKDSELTSSTIHTTVSQDVIRTTIQRGNADCFPLVTTESQEEQDLDLLPTPELALSPITPKTQGSAFPDTPTGETSNFPTPTLKNAEGKDSASYYEDLATVGEKDLDPMTIFVGGLEMFGPSAWDEQRLHRFFAQFGVVENVKFVRPMNSRSAFAFVTFSDAHAPVRAVQQAHNSIHGGRQMRVQIRDCNPNHRTTWKSARARSKYPSYTVHRPYTENVPCSDSRNYGHQTVKTHEQPHGHEVTGFHDSNLRTGGDLVRTSPATEFPTLNSVITRPTLPPCPSAKADIGYDEQHANNFRGQVTDPPCVGISPATFATPTEAFREWYEEPLSVNPTVPSSISASSSSPAPVAPGLMSYPMPNMGFYPPPAWVQPFHYMASYGFPVPTPQLNMIPGSDSTGPPAPMHSTWAPSGGLYAPYVPYNRFPVNAQGMDQPQVPQAPVVPTGFIQGEQGTLIALYNPDALERYMSAGGPVAPPLPQSQSQHGSNWQQVPQHQPATFVPPPTMPASLSSQTFQVPPNQTGAGMGWIPSQGLLHTHPPFHPPNIITPDFLQHYSHSLREPHSEATGVKRIQRRDQQNIHSGNRNNSNRPSPGRTRFPRGSGNNVDHHPTSYPLPTDWGQWTGNR